MKTIGFLKSTKKNEKRRAVIPEDIKSVKNKNSLFFEKDYGLVLGISDSDYINVGANVVTFNEAITKDIICDPKIGDANYLDNLRSNQTVFGWIHAVQNRTITDILTKKKLSAIAWEDMFEENRHIFWRNNELAGEAAVLHAFTLFGKLPYECKVAILGKGNTGRGAYKTLTSLGADVTVYDRKTEKLLIKELDNFDVFVNAVLWDTYRNDHVIYEKDLPRMKKPAMIIDVSCDKSGAVETSMPTSIEKPVYLKQNVLHYVVDHTPSLINCSASKALSFEVVKFLDDLIEENQNSILENAKIIKSGNIIDKRIIEYQKR